MGELLTQLRVRREELYASRSPSPAAPDAELEAALRRQLEEIYGPTNIANPPISAIRDVENDYVTKEDEDDVEGFEFRLFAAPIQPAEDVSGQSLVAPTKIILEDTDIVGEGAFVKPDRNPAYYFTGTVSDIRKKQFNLSAVSGDDVRKWLGVKYTAWEMPWKSQVIKLVGRKAAKGVVCPIAITDQVVVSKESTKRKKPGKKKRIRSRQLHKKEQELKEMHDRKAVSKTEAEKEKRARLNRTKKLRKKAKEKATKAASRSEGPVLVPVDDEVPSDGGHNDNPTWRK